MLEAAIAQTVVGTDRRNLIQGFALLLSAIEQAGTLLAREGVIAPVTQRQRNNDSYSFQGEEEVQEAHESGLTGNWGANYLDSMRDNFVSYEESKLADGRLLRRYETGTVRLINPHSDVIQEESPNGNLVVSLPDGKVLFQENPGHPLLLFDSYNMGPPQLARVTMMRLGDSTDATPAFTFSDDENTSIVDMNTLRYFRIRREARQEAA